MTPSQARVWLRDRLALREEGLTDVDQLVFLRGMFPGVPIGVLARVCVQALKRFDGRLDGFAVEPTVPKIHE